MSCLNKFSFQQECIITQLEIKKTKNKKNTKSLSFDSEYVYYTRNPHNSHMSGHLRPHLIKQHAGQMQHLGATALTYGP